MKSVLQAEKACLMCGTELDLHCHHVFFGTANRKKSEKYGFKVWLCGRHHNMSNYGIHFDTCFDNAVKMMAQRYFEENLGTRDDFRKEFGKSWL